MVIPVGKDVQDLRRVRKPADGGPPEVESLMPVRFVPMTGTDAPAATEPGGSSDQARLAGPSEPGSPSDPDAGSDPAASSEPGTPADPGSPSES